jgi:hypothetical protein
MNKFYKIIVTSLLLFACFSSTQAYDYEQVETYKTQFTPILEKISIKYGKEKLIPFHNKVEALIIKLDNKTELSTKESKLYNRLIAINEVFTYNILPNYQ